VAAGSEARRRADPCKTGLIGRLAALPESNSTLSVLFWAVSVGLELCKPGSVVRRRADPCKTEFIEDARRATGIQ
jgi:hypothetical protein